MITFNKWMEMNTNAKFPHGKPQPSRQGPDFDSFTPEDIEKYKRLFSCSGCGVNVSPRFGGVAESGYMLNDDLWKQIFSSHVNANPEGHQFLCIKCLKDWIGREIQPSDFKVINPDLRDRIFN